MQAEIWKDVVGYETEYQVSNLGNVKSLTRMAGSKRPRLRLGRIMKQKKNRGGYLCVHLRGLSGESWPTVHRLVASAFIENTENKPTINHIDGVKTNNCVENLEWSTMSEQMIHAIKTGLYVQPDISKYTKYGEDAHNCKIKNSDVIKIIELRKNGCTLKSIADLFGVGISQIHRICKGESRVVKN